MSTPLTNVPETRTTGSEPTVARFDIPRSPAGTEFNQGASVTGSFAGVADRQYERRTFSSRPISIDLLYQAREAGSKNFNRALELLAQACEALSEARAAVESRDRITRASEVMRFEELLQPLFECRAIGEGFANVINSIHMSIANLQGEPLSDTQINVLWRVMREVSSAPFFGFAESLKFVRQLGQTGLGINSNFLVEWASESSEGGEK